VSARKGERSSSGGGWATIDLTWGSQVAKGNLLPSSMLANQKKRILEEEEKGKKKVRGGGGGDCRNRGRCKAGGKVAREVTSFSFKKGHTILVGRWTRIRRRQHLLGEH